MFCSNDSGETPKVLPFPPAVSDCFDKKWVLDILRGHIHTGDLKSYIRELDIVFQSGVCMIVECKDNVALELLRDVLRNCGWPEGMHAFICDRGDSLYSIALYEGSGAIRAASEHMKTVMRREDRLMSVICAIGPEFTQLEEAKDSFFHAHTLLSGNVEGRAMLVFDSPVVDFRMSEIEAIEEADNKLIRFILNKDVQNAVRQARYVFDWFFLIQNEDTQSVIPRLALFAKHLATDCIKKHRLNVDTDSLPVFNINDTRDELKEKLIRFITDLTDAAVNLSLDKISQFGMDMAVYVQRHYAEDISLQRAAQDMNYSEFYFCKLFKLCFGKTFNDYLTEVRINAAQKLLENPRARIKDVGVQVGYHDNNYFTKIFKRMTGKSPTEYRAGIR